LGFAIDPARVLAATALHFSVQGVAGFLVKMDAALLALEIHCGALLRGEK
jgi:hypothetical protein